ncbi:MAG: hypothetical protein AB7F43_04210 [Bacteriovoracia bacterium]
MRTLVLFLLTWNFANAGMNCTVFEEFADGARRSRLDKEVGKDLGRDFSNEGYYDCQMDLGKEVESSGFLYIGEVGDASSLTIITPKGRSIYISHGINNKGTESFYMRYIPFFVEISRFFDTSGVYHFKLKFTNIFPPQKGLRSGIPVVVDLKSLILKVIWDSRTISYYIILALFIFAIFLDDLISRRISRVSSGFLISTILVLVSLSAVPRTFLKPLVAVRLNDCVHMIHYFLFFRVLVESVRENYTSRVGKVLTSGLLVGALIYTFFGYWNLTFTGLVYTMFFLAPIGLFLRSTFLGKVKYRFGRVFPNWLRFSVVSVFLIYSLDFCNLLFLNSSLPYISHLIGIPVLLIVYKFIRRDRIIMFETLERLSESIRRSTVEYSALKAGETQKSIRQIVKSLGFAVRSGTVSIMREKGEKVFFVVSLDENSEKFSQLYVKYEDTKFIKNVIHGTSNVYYAEAEGEPLAIYPVTASGDDRLHISFTGFFENRVPDNMDEILSFVSLDLESFARTFSWKEHAIDQNRLLLAMRGRVHWLQNLTEEYVLTNFLISENVGLVAVIRGDMAYSTSYNELFGVETISSVVDRYFETLWKTSSELGFVINRINGDEVFFIFPPLFADEKKDVVKRAFILLQKLYNHEVELEKIVQQHNINVPIKFRFVLTTISAPVANDLSIKSINQVPDTEMDSAKRVLDSIAHEGECIVLEEAMKHIQEEADNVIELPPTRMRGKLKSSRCFSLFKSNKFENETG